MHRRDALKLLPAAVLPLLALDGQGETAAPTQIATAGVLERLDNMIGIQSQSGNWDYSPYMQGMLNGLILARSAIIPEDNPPFRAAPAEWLCDRATKK